MKCTKRVILHSCFFELKFKLLRRELRCRIKAKTTERASEFFLSRLIRRNFHIENSWQVKSKPCISAARSAFIKSEKEFR